MKTRAYSNEKLVCVFIEEGFAGTLDDKTKGERENDSDF